MASKGSAKMNGVIDIKEAEQKPEILPVKYNIRDEAISQLREKYASLKIIDKESHKAVLAAISDIRGRRTAVEAKRKELKAVSLDYGRRIDAEAKRITVLLEEIEEPLKAKRQVEDEKESKRITSIQARIDAIRAKVPMAPTSSSDLREIKFDIDIMEIGADFEEFQAQAEGARVEVSAKLGELINVRVQWEAEEKFRQEEFARLEAARAENAKIEAERKASADAEERARRVEREAFEAEKRALAAERLRFELIERDNRELVERNESEKRAIIERDTSVRTEMLLVVGCECIPQNVGIIAQSHFDNLYHEHKKAWDIRQQKIKLEREEKTAMERVEFKRIATEKAEREAKEKAEREESERKVQVEAEEVERIRQEALRPDREKLVAFASDLLDLNFPDLSNANSIKILDHTKEMLTEVRKYINSAVNEL